MHTTVVEMCCNMTYLGHKDFLTWLLVGWLQAASQSEAMLENHS